MKINRECVTGGELVITPVEHAIIAAGHQHVFFLYRKCGGYGRHLKYLSPNT